jgi:UDP-N-acetylglucosamine 2-epimerase (non-hydrolysing)/GDP/UDP-N,N'-diacetylbacillosamine 2-epimerase (hydrolysing)
MRKIAIVTERRADYSRFRPILRLIKERKDLEYALIVTGIHLVPEHGMDIRRVETDGHAIAAVLHMFRENAPDTGAEMARAMGRAAIQLADEFERIGPDLVLSGFDIGANFAATYVAAHMNIPVAHIQGGEVSGSIDESIRHAMSKFAHIHFPATQRSAERLIRMGEDPRNIYVVGCPSLDEILQTPWVGDAEVAGQFGLDLGQPVLLLIQHPVTTEDARAGEQIALTLQALRNVNAQTIALLPNNDAGSRQIIEGLKGSRIQVHPSLPATLFINLYRRVSAIVGNSSSGIHEAASLKVPTVNIGSRQQGRERPGSVLDVPHDALAIEEAIRKAIYDEAFRDKVRACVNPYGDGRAAERIVDILARISLEGLVQKKFHDGSGV